MYMGAGKFEKTRSGNTLEQEVATKDQLDRIQSVSLVKDLFQRMIRNFGRGPLVNKRLFGRFGIGPSADNVGKIPGEV